MFSYIMSLRGEEIDIDLHSLNLDYTSFIYVNDESGNPVEYKSLYGGESNRIWVDYQDIPQYMKDAMVAIEDKRFWEHNGVDWWRTLGAASNLLSSGGSFGGSTITQQLIKNLTGDYPALLGLDMMDYTPSRTAFGTSSSAVEKAIEFANKGGIVTFCWHWNAPTEYLNSTANSPDGWWGGFYTQSSKFDIAKVMNGQDAKGKKLLDRDIKEIAKQLKRLEKAGVPVIWRPLHEGSGGWFWWGAKGSDAYKKLWKYLYKELTNTYGCNNLIWVYNGQSADWYPGDEYVDIVGEDIYPGNHVYDPQVSRFKQAINYGSKTKITALTENGCIFDIDSAVSINALWSWFMTWGGEFTVNGSNYSEKYTEKSVIQKMYASKYSLTLGSLPKIY